MFAVSNDSKIITSPISSTSLTRETPTSNNVTPWALRQKVLQNSQQRIRSLQSQLEAEQLEKLELEEQIRQLKENLHSCGKKIQAYQQEVQNLGAINEDLLTQVEKGADPSVLIGRLQQQDIKHKEKCKHLEQEIEEITADKQELATKAHQIALKSREWEITAIHLQNTVAELESKMLEKDQEVTTLTQALQASQVDISDLQHMMEDTQQRTPFHSRLHYSLQSPMYSNLVSPCPSGENLGATVVDIKLKEAEESLQHFQTMNESLETEKDLLLQQIRETRNQFQQMQEELETKTQLLNEQEKIMSYLHNKNIILKDKLERKEIECSDLQVMIKQLEEQNQELIGQQETLALIVEAANKDKEKNSCELNNMQIDTEPKLTTKRTCCICQ